VEARQSEPSRSEAPKNSTSGLLLPLVPMLVVQHLLDVQSVFASAAILDDPVDQHRDLWHGRIHPVEQAQFEWD
jgi:hypothetical protein